MTLRSTIAVAVLALTACATSTVVAAADPAPEVVKYHVTAAHSAAVITTDSGSMVVEGGAFKIKSADGQVLAGIPLSVRIDDADYPIAATVDGHTATLTPAALPFQDEAPWRTRYEREQAAFARASLQITTAAAGGAALGTAIGGAVGCIGGALVGTVVTGMLAALFGAGPLAGCLAGIAIGGGIGAFGGALLVTAPVAVASVIQYFTTVNEPFTPGTPQAK